MIDYSKKSKEHLFLIFLIGGLYGLLDKGGFDFNSFELGYFFGSALSMMFISVFIGYIIHLIIGKFNLDKKKNLKDDIIDDTFETGKSNELKDNIIYKLRPFKFGVYVAILFLTILIINELFT